MGLNDTPNSERIHIGLFGRRNVGKSSLINAITGQSLAVVSDVAGTTTDPVSKAMELLPLGPVLITDTAGLDDEGELGGLRVDKSYRVLAKTDIALVVTDGSSDGGYDGEIVKRLKERDIPYIIVHNKSDLSEKETPTAENEIYVSALTGKNIYELKELMAKLLDSGDSGRRICADLLKPNDTAVLVVPIDSAAPKGRLILPQQQTIRDILEAGAVAAVCRDTELTAALSRLGGKPRLVITDSQAFKRVAKEVPEDIPLTSFSILFARYKGGLEFYVRGVTALGKLQDGDRVLISEGCTHHRQCDDIGTVKLPAWIREFTGKNVEFEFTSGGEFPQKPDKYSLIVHCGGCTLNEREMKYRRECAAAAGVPMTNYGIAIAYMNGILKRSIEPLGIGSLLERHMNK